MDNMRVTYDLSRGIQDILPFERSSLPGRASLAPADMPRSALLANLYAERNCAAIISAFLRPSVRNLENLSPERHRRGLRACRDELKDEDDPALAALGALLQEDCERLDLLESFQGLLLAG
ncbi:MAG: hypothetical protein LBQ63_04660 [Deltaproteobacteria bacterium]|jgi:hypothetical protein|nr:hypothetical protein [Deltaproteobacteria bacterium]